MQDAFLRPTAMDGGSAANADAFSGPQPIFVRTSMSSGKKIVSSAR
jgi:hypothetical protein